MRRILKELVVVVALLSSNGLHAMQYITGIETNEPDTDLTIASYEDPMYTGFDVEGGFLKPQTEAKSTHLFLKNPSTIFFDRGLEIPFGSHDRVVVTIFLEDNTQPVGITLASAQITDDRPNPSGKWLLVFDQGNISFRPQA